jgi:hypothetical protein
MMSRKPLLLCDIDGVISLWGGDPNKRPPGVWHSVDGIAHFLSGIAARALLDLSADFALVWCSGWEERADEHLPHLLGVPAGLPHLCFDRPVGGGASSRAHWKLEAIDTFAGPTRPLAWIDDALNEACREWAGARGGPTLLVETDPAYGLTVDHVARLRSWARALAPR